MFTYIHSMIYTWANIQPTHPAHRSRPPQWPALVSRCNECRPVEWRGRRVGTDSEGETAAEGVGHHSSWHPGVASESQGTLGATHIFGDFIVDSIQVHWNPKLQNYPTALAPGWWGFSLGNICRTPVSSSQTIVDHLCDALWLTSMNPLTITNNWGLNFLDIPDWVIAMGLQRDRKITWTWPCWWWLDLDISWYISISTWLFVIM